MSGVREVVAQVVGDRGWLTIVVATLAFLLKRILDATLPRGYHFRAVERWLRPGRDRDDEKDETDEERR